MRPVFIRLPEAQVRDLEHACRVRGMTKQAFVSAAVVNELGDSKSTVGRATVQDADEVLTLLELADLLKVEVDVLRERVEAGDVPGRRFGEEWRFSRAGVLAWLSAPTEPGRRAAAGFEARH